MVGGKSQNGKGFDSFTVLEPPSWFILISMVSGISVLDIQDRPNSIDRKRHMFYLVYGIIFVVLIAGCVMAAKHWHWVNTVFLVLTFISGVAATAGMAKVFYKRSKAVQAYNKIVQDHAKASQELNVAIYGKPSDIGYGEQSLRAVSNKLNLELLGRGRVWSGGAVDSAGEGKWNFKFANAVPEGEGNQLDQLEQIEVQVFRDQVINRRAYPVSYIGEFRITQATLEGFELQGLQIVDASEASEPSSTWSIYEKMPLDRRGAFKDAIAAMAKDGVDVEEMSIEQFREILTTQFFPAQRVPFDVDSVQYERLIDSYAFDGMSLGKIQNWVDANLANRKSGQFQPRPEEVHVKFRFNGPSKEYTVDAEGNLETDGPFTPLGHAVSRNLHLGKKVTFEEGDEVVIDQLTAEGYQRDGTTIAPFPQTENVTEIDRIYLREHRDYPFMFSSLQGQAESLVEILEARKRDNATHDNSIAKDLNEQIEERTRIQADLQFDNTKLEKDRDLIAGYEAKKSAQVDSLAKQVASLEDQKVNLRRQIGAAAAVIRKSVEQAKTSVSINSEFSSRRSGIKRPVGGDLPVYSIGPVDQFGQPIPIVAPPVVTPQLNFSDQPSAPNTSVIVTPETALEFFETSQ